MAQEFYPNEAEQRLRSLAIILENRLRNRIQPDEVFPIVNELANRIAEQLGVSFSFRRDVADLVRPSVAENALAMNPVELFQSVARTLSFARETHLGGVPTLAPENSINQGSEAPTYTIIDVYNRKAIAKAQPLFRPPPDPAEVANQRLADWLRLVVSEHPWARISEEAVVVQGLGMGLSMFVARSVHATATGQQTTLSYTVNTQNSGLVLDAFPELQYAPRRFGSTVSTPVNGNLSNGWWKFETMINGALVRDRGRHLASSTSTSTITSDF